MPRDSRHSRKHNLRRPSPANLPYNVGATSIGPGITCGVPGIIIVACGIPGGQSDGGHLSPRLNQPPLICRHLLQPARLVTTSTNPANRNSFFDISSSLRVIKHPSCVPSTLAPAARCANAAVAFSHHLPLSDGRTLPKIPPARPARAVIASGQQQECPSATAETLLERYSAPPQKCAGPARGQRGPHNRHHWINTSCGTRRFGAKTAHRVALVAAHHRP
jgi:hypothetical protein